MDYARDLGRVDVWEDSLKRSLERRGRPRRSSVELYRLRPERDLTLGDVLERSASYSELRRRAAQRTAMPRPSVALGGISALALVAGSTLPSLLGGGRASHKERVAYAADAHAQARAEAAVKGSWGSSLESTGAHAASGSHGSPPQSAPVTAAHTTVAHSATAAPVARATGVSHEVTPEAVAASTTPSYSGGVAVAASASAPHHGGIRLVSDTTPAPSQVQQAPVATARPAATAEATATPAPATGRVTVSERPASQGTVEQLSGGTPERTITPTPPRATTPERTTTPAPPRATTPPTTPTRPTTAPATPTRPTTTTAPTTSSSTTTTGSPAPSSDVQQGINRMIAAGNQIATRPYVYGGGHGSFNSNGYDCSGSVSYVLHAAGLLRSPEDSTELESYGAPGPGRYVTVYANSGHAWMTIQGRRFDTVALAENGSRWSNSTTSTSGYVARHPNRY